MIYIIFCSISFGCFMIFLKYIDKKCINNVIHSSIGNDNNQDLIINEYDSPIIEINVISKKNNFINDLNQFSYTPKISDIINLYCPICLEIIRSNNHSLVKLNCNHVFHKKCIQEWQEKNNSCPFCREQIL